MRKFLLSSIFLAAFALMACAQQALHNDAIIKMVKAGLSDDLIVTAIESEMGAVG